MNLDKLLIDEVVSGCANRADLEGEEYAIRRGIPITRFPANWKKHGRAARLIRNKQMTEYADALAVFSGEKGTENMVKRAEENNLTIYDSRL